MHFRDRDGRPLTVGQWHELFANPSYSIVKRDSRKIGKVVTGQVVTSWMGFLTGDDTRKNLFLVERLEGEREGNGSQWILRCVETAWAETEQQALEIHAMYQRRI